MYFFDAVPDCISTANENFSSLCTMFNKLQQKWGVSSSQFLLILCTFAVTGTTTAWVSRQITAWVGFNENTFWAWKLLLRLSILIFGYQAILLTVSVVFGQFRFFWNYEKKILRRMKLYPQAQVRLAIFASGKGSNAEKIIQTFENHKFIRISLIVSNRSDAGVLKIASRYGIKSLIINKDNFTHGDEYVQNVVNEGITHIVLAGFLWKVPEKLLQAFPKRIINIHPALLPKFGGKGMYGAHVHQAVIEAKEKESGITIHLVDEEYDHGKTIFQIKTEVRPDETVNSLAEKIHELEHKHYPEVIRKWVMKYAPLLISFFLCTNVLNAQIWLTGRVYDSSRMVTIPSVKITTKQGLITYTDSLGKYGLNVDKNDSINFTYRGKSTQYFPVSTIRYPAGFDIALQVVVQDRYRTLKEVVVIGKSYKQDSMENREKYRKVFEFGGGGLQISETGGMGGVPGLDLGSVIDVFRFRRNKTMKSLQNRLIEEEQQKFIDSRFTKSLVKQLTGFEGRELERFMAIWRPSYELIVYNEEYIYYQYILDAAKYFKQGIIPKTRTIN